MFLAAHLNEEIQSKCMLHSCADIIHFPCKTCVFIYKITLAGFECETGVQIQYIFILVCVSYIAPRQCVVFFASCVHIFHCCTQEK